MSATYNLLPLTQGVLTAICEGVDPLDAVLRRDAEIMRGVRATLHDLGLDGISPKTAIAWNPEIRATAARQVDTVSFIEQCGVFATPSRRR